jgi:cytochrome c oxidase subunit 2
LLRFISTINGEYMKRRFWMLMVLTASLSGLLFSNYKLRAQPEPRKIDVTLKRFSFDPGEITLKKGEPVLLTLKSADVSHGLRFRELNIDVKIDKGAAVEVPFTPSQTGDFVGHCSVFCGAGHGGMTLTLHVVE